MGLNINGEYYAFGDIEARFTAIGLGASLAASLFVGFTSINYNDKLGRAYVRGTARRPLGATSGQYEAAGDIEFHKPQADALIRGMGANWRQIAMTLTVTYSAVGLPSPLLPVTTDILEGVYLTDLDAPNADGVESMKRKFTLFIVGGINWGGIGPGFTEVKFPIAVG